MLKKAIEWRDRLKKFKTESKYPEHVQEHIEILDYLIMQAESEIKKLREQLNKTGETKIEFK